MDGLLISPAIGTIGQPVTVTPRGQPTGDVRYYLQTVAPGSKLPALVNFGALAALGSKPVDPLESAAWQSQRGHIIEGLAAYRLTENLDGSASFIPDAPGVYSVLAADVTVTVDVPHFGGDTPAAPTDNELDGSPFYGATVLVAEVRSRLFGVRQENATLAIKTVGAGLVPDIHAGVERVTLTPAVGPLALLAAADEDVLSALDGINGTTDVVAQLGLPALDIATAVAAWNVHIARDAGQDLHGEADPVAVTPEAPITAAQAYAALNSLKAAFNAHCLLGVPVHGSASGAYAITTGATPDAVDFSTALALWTALRDRLWGHMADNLQHSAIKADGAAYGWLEPPRSLLTLARKTAALVQVFTTHKMRLGYDATHAAVDGGNKVAISVGSVQALIDTVNAWADSIERHTSNRGRDGAPLSTGPHLYPAPQIIPLRALDLATAQRTAELCWVAYEAHALDWGPVPTGAEPPTPPGQGRAHGSPTWGAYGPGPMRDRLCLRLARAWQRATRGLVPPTAQGANPAGSAFVALYGWALSLRRLTLSRPSFAIAPLWRLRL